MILFDYDAKKRKGKLVCDNDILTFIRNHFSVVNKSASFANKKLKMQGKKPTIPDRQYCIQLTGNFDFGIYNEIRKFLISESITEISFSDSFRENLTVGFGTETLTDGLKYPLRDYQAETIQKCLRFGRGTVVLATGAGKSLVQASLLENIKLIKGSLKCLLIVPGTGLVHQLMKDFEEYEVSFTYSPWTGEMDTKGNKINPLQDTEVVIVNTENLCSQFGNYPKLLDVDYVLTDECHKTKFGNEMSKIIAKMKTPNKFGFTGTLPKDDIDRWKIIGTFGPIVYEKNSKELRDEKFLTNTEVKCLKLIHSPAPKFGYKREVEFLEKCDERNELIAKLANKLKKNILILVNHLEHGELLLSYCNAFEKRAFFVSGDMPVDERQEIISMMECNDDLIVVAMSSIFSTGINVKNLHYVMFTFGGKAFIRTIQSIGRGVRLHDTKEKLVIFDIYDNMKYSMAHSEERKIFYEEEQHTWTETEIKI
jgi:superfamily II DNA or RNA helicase